MTNKQIPETSVLLSTFNNESTIKNSIESIIDQTYEDFEFLIIDDASTDNTFKILNEFEDERIYVFKNRTNIGLTKSLNFLIQKSKGKYLARQDGDDLSFKDRLKIQREFINQSKYQICSSRAINQSTQKKIPGYSHYLPEKLLFKFKNPHIHGTLFMEKSVIENIGGYDENFYYAQDFKLYCDLKRRHIDIKRLNRILYSLNTKNNISTNKKKTQKYYFDCAKNNVIPN